MNIQQFLSHHGIQRNPFCEEDAQTDPVFKDFCIVNTYHPAWDKVYGDPAEPSTSIVFGEKGAGKTAMRLQIARHLTLYNRAHPHQRLFVVHYDDFNPFLDRFRDHMHGRRRPDRVLAHWKLWDHMDAILALGVTALVDELLQARRTSSLIDIDIDGPAIERLDRNQQRDLLLLAGCYDQSLAESHKERWKRLRRRLRFPTWKAHWHLATGVLSNVLILALAIAVASAGHATWLSSLWYLWLAAIVAGWLPWLAKIVKRTWLAFRVRRSLRVGNHTLAALRAILMEFSSAQLASQPLPRGDSTDARYEMLLKLQGVLESFSYRGIIVLVDRLDEPHLINGSAERMRAFLWPLLDNKLLTHPGLGLKLMLPIELTRFIDREDQDFFQRARLDKQNMVRSFQWSGEALHDVANARIAACSVEGAEPTLRDLFDPSVSDQRLMEVMRTLRVPRHLFKFMYRVLVDHCSAHTDQTPAWAISEKTLESTLAVYRREQDAADRDVGLG